MATVRPLIRYADTGKLEELRSGDSLHGGGGGGGGDPWTKATVSIVPAKFGHAYFNVVDAAALGTQSVLVQLVPNSQLDADDLHGLSIAGTAKNGSVDFVLSTKGALAGNFSYAYKLV